MGSGKVEFLPMYQAAEASGAPFHHGFLSARRQIVAVRGNVAEKAYRYTKITYVRVTVEK
jgi:hypothetical protein